MKRHLLATLTTLLLLAPIAASSAKPADSATSKSFDSIFLSPPRSHRVMQYAMSGGGDLNQMERYGLAGPVCAVSGNRYTKGPYLRDEVEWKRLTTQVAGALGRGMKVWLSDERGYPSGGAGDLVIEQHPEYENICLYRKTVEGHGKAPARIDLPPEARRFVGATAYPRGASGIRYDRGVPADVTTASVSTNGFDGDWTLCAFIERVVHEGTHAQVIAPGFGWKGRYPNLLNRDAVARFIEITHDAYARHLGPDLMSRVEAIYTNEPSLQTHYVRPGTRPNGECYVPWVDTLPDTFRKMHGYDLAPHLGALLCEDSTVQRRVRLHFYQTVGAMMADSFAGQISRWCRQRGTMMTGHLLCEELIAQHVPLFGDFFKQIQQFDLPGADVAIQKPADPVAGRYIGVRFVSSAARAEGKEHVQTLMDPILGGWQSENDRNKTIPLDALTHCVNMLFYNGANFMTTYGPWDKYPVEEYERFNLYAGRLALLLRDATNAAQVGVYYPLETFQGRYRPTPKYLWDEPKEYAALQSSVLNIVRLFHDNSIDYNFLNAEAVGQARVAGGALSLGRYRYKVLLMPSMEIVPLPVQKKIRQFESAGGQVFWTGALPRMGAYEREDAEVASLMSAYTTTTLNRALDAVNKSVPQEFHFDAPPNMRRAILTSKYARDGATMYYVINSGATSAGMTDIRFGDAPKARVCDPYTGAISVLDAGGKTSVAPYRALVFVCGGGDDFGQFGNPALTKN